MPRSLSFKRWIAGFGALSGAVMFSVHDNDANKMEQENSQTLHFPAWTKWNQNWDRRDPRSLIDPKKRNNITDTDAYNKELLKKTAKAIRHIILIRHGQYNTKAETEGEAKLTALGKQQAEMTGQRLQELNFPYSLLVHSTMIRAQETAEIIQKSLKNVKVKNDALLNEGAPIESDPVLNWKSEVHFYRDGPRIEAAFRKYFHRAEPSQEKDSYTILVCHANVIRYFVCRALQFSPESWIRLSLSHASITWITIYPDGIVTLWTFGDTGHMKPQLIS